MKIIRGLLLLKQSLVINANISSWYDFLSFLIDYEMLGFIPLYRFNEFGVDGGLAAKALGPKFDVFTKHVQSHVAMQVPDIEVRICARTRVHPCVFVI